MNEKGKFSSAPLTAIFTVAVLACSSCGGGGGGGDGGGGGCDLIANANGPAYFKVKNNLSTGVAWNFENAYPFGADMKPGECTNMGVAASQYTISFQQCNIGGAACTSTFGPTRMVVFSVNQGETHTIEVNSGFFN
jgi:hypothetical protein